MEDKGYALGFCRCCGQSVTIKNSGLETQEQVDEEATRNCNCPGAETLREREERIATALKKLKALTNGNHKEIKEILDEAIKLAAVGKVKSITVKSGDKTTYKINVTATGKIKITKEVKETETEEA